MNKELRQHIKQERNIIMRRIRWKDIQRERGYVYSETMARRRAVKEAGVRDTITDKTQTQELKSKDGSLGLDHRNGFGRMTFLSTPASSTER